MMLAPPSRRIPKPAQILTLLLALLPFLCFTPAQSQTLGAATLPSTVAAIPLAPVSKRQAEAAGKAYLDGVRLLQTNDLIPAETQFNKALALNPGNTDYIRALSLTREYRVTALVQQAGKARLLGHPQEADTLFSQARALDPQNVIVTQHLDQGPILAGFTPTLDATSTPVLAGPITLLPNASHQNFHLHADIKLVITDVVSKYGVRPVFDSSVATQDVRFDLEDTPYTQAIPILLQMGRLFAVPLDSSSVIIAKDTLENRARFERQLEETIYIPALTTEQMGELSNVVRNIFDLKQVSAQNSTGTLVVRAPESVLSAMNLTLADLIDGGSQVMLDLKLYAIDKTRSRNIGTQLPQQIGVYNVQAEAHNLVNANQSLVNQAIASGLVPANASDVTLALALIASGLVKSALLSNTIGFFGGGITATGITTNATPTFTLSLNSSDTRALEDIQLRIGDRQSATFRVGTRYPITTSTYSFGNSSATSAALAGITINGVSAASLLAKLQGGGTGGVIPQVQFEDLGITLKATPTVQKSNNVTIHLDLKIEALTGGILNNIPILASRQFTSDVTIADGQTALLVSDLSKTEAGAISGIPGLGELPGLQTVVADKTTELNSSDLVLLMTPHIVRRRSSIISGPRIALSLPHTAE
jgi:general secretion pathway protein D